MRNHIVIQLCVHFHGCDVDFRCLNVYRCGELMREVISAEKIKIKFKNGMELIKFVFCFILELFLDKNIFNYNYH